jgi:hypothetical protein
MSDAVATVREERDDAKAGPQTHQLLRRVRRIGYLLLGVQLAGYLIWSAVLYFHYSVTADYSLYNQAWFLIAHGDLDPFATIGNVTYWRNDAEFLPYLLAPLYWVVHSGLFLPWVQDLSVAGAEIVAFTWLCDLARRHCAERDAAWLAGLGLLLFIANPWLWWTVSFDVHEEPMVIFFAAYMAWDLSRGKRRAFVWMALVLIGGAPDATYVIGIGLGGILAGRQTRRMGAALAAAGIAYSLFLGVVHGNGAADGAIHGYLDTASGHPFRLVEVLWDRRADIIANLAPGGLVGIAAPTIMPIALMIVVANTLTGLNFAEPLFQSVPLYVLLPVGTVTVLAWLLRRHRRTAIVLAGVVAAQAVGWAVIWGPRTPGEWLLVSNSEAATLGSVQALVPGSAEVVASQGVLGRFTWRSGAYPIFSAGSEIPLQPDTWFVITPTTGIETVTPATSMALIGELAGPLHARLVTHANGVWAFQLSPPPGVREVTVPDGSQPLPAWAAAGAAGLAVLSGPVSGWHMAATGAAGYVSDGMQWQERPGRYRVTVTLSAWGPVNVEVWDDTTNALLARQSVAPTDGIQQIALPINAPDARDASVFSGWGPFQADFVSPRAGQGLEVRVWSPGGVAVNVYSALLTTPSGAVPPAIP